MALRVGTSGWGYEDWVGRVYPRSLAPAEWLRWYAERFTTVEVNVTYYRTPPRATVDAWLAKVRDAPRFELSLKAPGALVHEALAQASPEEAARLAREWREAVADPVARAGRLGAVLLQLSPYVRRDAPTLARLEAALDALAPLPLAVEPRHASWLERGSVARGALAALDARGAALVATDGPSFPAVLAGDARHAYVRFHGRNEDVWFKGRAVEEDESDPRLNRYDYAYKDEELAPWADRLADLARRKELVRVYFNNHPEGHGLRDAGRFAGLAEARGAEVERPAPSPQRRLDGFA